MITQVSLRNFGPFQELLWSGLSGINLVIGPNSSGKTILLKAIYSAIKTVEEYKKGDEFRSAADILMNKLYWTFQVNQIGDLVTKGAESGLDFEMVYEDAKFKYGFGRDTTKKIQFLESYIPKRESNSLFLPAKEILSIYKDILRSREYSNEFGFDDTYYDLAKAWLLQPKGGKNYKVFAEARNNLEELIDGKVEHNEQLDKLFFRRGKQRFDLGVTAEGVKKISILDTLLGNRYLDSQSILFVDEVESALHPDALMRFLEILYNISKLGVQIFISSHSYFVVKKLYLIARSKNISIPFLSYFENSWDTYDLSDGIPPNSIIEESVTLFHEEIDLAVH
ncbi:MAG: AAA family ATPase [Ignavibacteriales bacterium]|nr:MAG: AAA family ATPase [Ignavibacteriaceae bacterium]MBW7873120.1 AAA family ATPase [Ignavibacteria bacterium]MCZ2142763.1 AAA family ATPase [Ignavibacteriales bacterium]OQY73968.1 MAG: ATPase [Ignavibacteriales bacterium UTCHB3]MBV6443857.1 hypothetical protein [Ignavibacteriaceae bacterium]